MARSLLQQGSQESRRLVLRRWPRPQAGLRVSTSEVKVANGHAGSGLWWFGGSCKTSQRVACRFVDARFSMWVRKARVPCPDCPFRGRRLLAIGCRDDPDAMPHFPPEPTTQGEVRNTLHLHWEEAVIRARREGRVFHTEHYGILTRKL